MASEGVKRKLTAIVSADVEGYSRLMGDDEVSTMRTLEAYREVMSDLIQQHRGRVVDSPGDNLLAEFASVVDAAQCAVEIQKVIKAKNEDLPSNRKMRFRIGINLGDVIDEGERIYGDGVNIAARMESLAEGGGICVSGSAYDQIENKLALGYEYLGKHNVKNIKRAVRVYRVPLDQKSGKSLTRRGKRARKSKLLKAAIAMVAIIIMTAFGIAVWDYYLNPASTLKMLHKKKKAFPIAEEKPSIAVLPFDNMSGDPQQEYLSDGISENIIAALSKIEEMMVIARNSTFTYKDKPVKVQQIGKDLGARYVLEGSVQKSNDRVRITAQLIDAKTGHHLWSERYDRELKDLFTIQDEITKKIVTALQVRLTEGAQANFRYSTDNFEAWSYVVKGGTFFERFNKESNAKARELFRRAVDLDPQYNFALTMLGWTYLIESWFGFSESSVDSAKQAHELANKSIKLDDTSPDVHSLLAGVYLLQRNHAKAIEEGRKAIELGPNHALSYMILAKIMIYSGRFEDAIILAKKAMLLTPYYPAWYLDTLGEGYLMAGHYKKAIATYKELLVRSKSGECPPYWGHMGLASSYASLGRIRKAKVHASEVLKGLPGFTLEDWCSKTNFYKDPVHLERSLEAMRKAGFK